MTFHVKIKVLVITINVDDRTANHDQLAINSSDNDVSTTCREYVDIDEPELIRDIKLIKHQLQLNAKQISELSSLSKTLSAKIVYWYNQTALIFVARLQIQTESVSVSTPSTTEYDNDQSKSTNMKDVELENVKQQLISLNSKMDIIMFQFKQLLQELPDLDIISINNITPDNLHKVVITNMRHNAIVLNLKHHQLSHPIDLDHNQLKVKKWLEEEVKLGTLFKRFMETGFDDLDTVKELNNDTLKQMGIEHIGHRIKILENVRLLNQVNSQK